MLTRVLRPEDVRASYATLASVYPTIPSLLTWRAWELASYKAYQLPEPVIDIGCGDGSFFRLVWPAISDATGIDADPNAAEAARRSGVYQDIVNVTADRLVVPHASFSSAFANCSLEHMDHLDSVLNCIAGSLRPGAPFLFSVVTDKLVEWNTLSGLIRLIGAPDLANQLHRSYTNYHHLVSAFTPAVWANKLEAAQLRVIEHTPILPELTSRLFLFTDHLWHVPHDSGEIGDLIHARFSAAPALTRALLKVLSAVLEAEPDLTTGSGAVFYGQRA